MLASRYVSMRSIASSPHSSLERSQCLHSLQEPHSSLNGQAEELLTLSNFVSKYEQALPLRITVEKGYYGADERHSIATGDVYNVHFVKHNKVALLRDSGDTEYTIPLNSAVQFGLVFNPIGNSKVALQGFHFERVSDIMAQISLPKVIHASKPHITSDPKSSVEEHEILVVQKIVHTPMRKKALQVYSITRGEQKMLESDCLGSFTTDPYTNRLHLPDIIEHFSDEFPLEVLVVMEEANIPENLPYDVTSEVSSLTGVRTETSLIASTTLEEEEDIKQSPIEIPANLLIDVRVTQLEDEAELERLYAYTRKLYEQFDPFNTLSINTSSSKLSTAVRSGFEMKGFKLQRPDSIYDILSSQHAFQSPAILNHASTTCKKSVRGTRLPPPPKPKSYGKYQLPPQAAAGSPSEDSNECVFHEYQPLFMPPRTQRQSYEVCTSPHSLGRQNGSFPENSEEGTKTASMTLLEFENLRARVEMLEREVYALRSEMAMLKSQSGSGAVVSTQQALQKENIQHLKTFSIKKVAELLQVVNMSQYCERFVSEQITGEILSECDQRMLAEELGVSNRIHCKLLLQIISGKISAAALLATQSPCS